MSNRNPLRRWSALCLLGGLWLATLPAAQAQLPDFTRLVDAYSPAVVNISTTQRKSASGHFGQDFGLPELPQDSPFHEFFRRFLDEDTLEQLPEPFDSKSLGSGFIISKDGYVMTNHHVVKGADEILVRLSDHRELEAEVIGTDKQSDLAVLKIEADNLPTVKIGQSPDLKVGEWVLAIGSPFGFDHSVTAGIVSAKGRSLPSENYVPFIQTDVAINPGNSGGPLFNLDGEVVGVNSQIYSRTGGFMGLSFAIPIEMAMNVADQLRTQGHVSRGWLGVLIQDVTRELADSFEMQYPRGALVANVLADSPAERAGLRVGDIILRYDDKKLSDSAQLPPLVGLTPVGETARLTVLRDAREKTIEVRIGELPEDGTVSQARPQTPEQDEQRLGLTVEDLTAEQRKALELDDKDGGVYVRRVGPGPARQAGIREGDVIQMLNNTRVKDVAGFESLAQALPAGKTVAVLVHRRRGPIFLAMRLPE